MNPRWERWLQTTRLRPSGPGKRDDLRTSFESDRDRVIFLPAFRRLQDKTQVFPLEAHDFVRTRLTHSLEVAALGRTLGLEVGRWLLEQGELDAASAWRDVPTLVETACLAHDLGNPPFGHSGESAIRSWFADRRQEPFFRGLEPAEQSDLLHFEGNAQGFRILTRLARVHDDKGLNLTVATLATFTKYPVLSSEPREEWGKKFGAFLSEAPALERIAEQLELPRRRHPLAFVMEAADDIAYRVIDVEDAARKGLLAVAEVAATLEAVEPPDAGFHEQVLAARERYARKRGDPDAERAWMHDLRLACTSALFRAAFEGFCRAYPAILAGEHHASLLRGSPAEPLANALFRLGLEHAYTHPSVLRLELEGKKTLHRLLDAIVPACLASSAVRHDKRTWEGKLYALLSRNQRFLFETSPTPGSETYRALQLACDFVSGMTDSFAVRFARSL